jgi:DNA-binding CsgD family transcriptional regulator
LHAAIAAALQATGRIVDGNRQVTMLARGVGRRPLAVVAIPVTPVGARHVPDSTAVALIVTDPEQIRVPRVETIRSMLGLTSAEARLVHCLADGLTLKDSAERLGINLETARKRLKLVFQKTDIHRQADLVKVVTNVGGL